MIRKDETINSDEQQSAREVSRWLAYPLLFVVPIGCIYLGIKLGSAEVGARLMLSSQNGTPVENWTLSLIAACIAIFMYSSWAYKHKTLRVRPKSFLMILTYIVLIFLFGVWGLYALGIPSVICLFYWIKYKRKVARDKTLSG